MFRFNRGEPIVLHAQIDDAGSYDPTTLTVLADMKAGQFPPAASVAAAATFTPSFVAAANGNPAYWLLYIDAATSQNIAAGIYVADIEISSGGNAIKIIGPFNIVIQETVTP